ncbi:MAG: hypothetical protein WEC00_07840 [Dongiaceae bacterium]
MGPEMQQEFSLSKEQVSEFCASLSKARFARYLTEANGDEQKALKLYFWNVKLSQSLYLPLQTWEVCLRNKLNAFLSWKFNSKWPFDIKRAIRQLNARDKQKVADAIERQERDRGKGNVSTDAIVADLSVGFWVSLLTAGYDPKFAWRYNLTRVFPNATKEWDREAAHTDCDLLLNARNRVAHHEPIYHLDLKGVHEAALRTLRGMCPASYVYVEQTCDFRERLKVRP